MLLLLLSFTIVRSATECGPSYCNENNECFGVAGGDIVIPCGPQVSEIVGVLFTYYNRSSEKILLNSTLSTEYAYGLKLNLSSYDDGVTISCRRGLDNTVPTFDYHLSVCYKPRILTPIPSSLGKGMYRNELDLPCPLNGNPAQTCSWDVNRCNGVTIADLLGISYKNDDNCTLHIDSLTLKYTNICFNCTATNAVGSTSFFFNPIDFTTCSQDQQIFINVNGTQSKDVITAYLGESLELVCEAYGAYYLSNLQWSINNEFSEDTTYMFSERACLKSGKLYLDDLSYNNSGNYSCYFGDARSYLVHTIELKVQSRQTESTESSGRSDRALYIILPSVVTVTITITALVFLTTIIMFLLFRRRSSVRSSTSEESPIDFIIFENEYDLFLSFAEEDKTIVEEILKKPLEKIGYKICWHHDAFIPGYTVVENMERSIYKSRFTIAVLSNNFMLSEFCLKELRIAVKKNKQTSMNCLMPVILENSCDLPPEIFKITYININDKNFMEKLRATLGDPVDPSP